MQSKTLITLSAALFTVGFVTTAMAQVPAQPPMFAILLRR